VKINSTKSMIGHTLGAAAAIEAITCCKSIENGVIHSTQNLENPDPNCDLNFASDKNIELNVNYALSNSLGFGGHNGVLVFHRYNE